MNADQAERALYVEPGAPRGNGVFHRVEGFPWSAWLDDCGLVKADDGFSQCVLRLFPGLQI